ncbi:MAG: transketolase C-terminal domain-containing protein [Candidatus Micrarchaeia archaeon]
MREAYGEALAELGTTNKNVVVLDADLSSSTKTSLFAKRFPNRFFEVGIAEQNLLGTAAGLAAAGKIPFASTFAVFASGRAWEQARNAIAYADLNVKIVATHAGLSVGPDGATHQALEDVALMRAIPRFRVCVPCDAAETREMVYAFAAVRGPCYARLPRIESPEITDGGKFVFGRWPVLHEGGDACIIANGLMVAEALEAARLLAKSGTRVRVLNASTVKPLDERALLRAATTGAVVTAEEHSIIGGLGGAVCEFVSERKPCIVKRVGTRDVFGESGESRELFEKYGLTAAAIAKAVHAAMKRA